MAMHQHFFTDNTTQKEEFSLLLAQPKKIVITTHQNPDGDAMGSSLGLAGVLKKMGHQVVVIPPTEPANYLRWMPHQELVICFEGNQQNEAKEKINEAELIFCLDFSVLDRIKNMAPLVRESNAIIVMVDHHQEPESFANYVFWNEKAAAACELVYQLIEKTVGADLIGKDEASCLYAGLVTDTGSFRYDATTSDVHRIAGELISKGIRNSLIHRQLFDTNSIDRLRFLGYALHQKLVHLPEYNAAYFTFTKEELQQFNSKNGDTEGIVNYGLSIQGVVFSAIFVERDDMIKISFRSVNNFSVSELSRQHFDGGGHHNAAGGRSYESLDATVQKFLNLLPSLQEKLLTT
jgi:bifunctional oligoribonuclease and PAP phosphatase NrnA